MILQNMVLKNFRQFRGTQDIAFSSGKKGNVTVVFGENGRGKTGLYRALLFCLYGEKKLSQDDQVNDKELYLVNYPEMEENSADNQPVIADVQLSFQHEGRSYNIERSLLGLLNKEGIVVEEDNGVQLIIQDNDGNSTTVRNPNEVSDCIASILDPGLREYFLFDGEKIERLTRASREQKKEISTGVRKLLNIDTLEAAKRATKRLRRDLYKDIESRATGEIAKIIKKIRENEDRTSELDERVIQIDEELQLAAAEKKKVDAELDKIRGIEDLLKDRKNKEKEIKSLDSELKELLLEMKAQSGKASLLLLKKPVEKVFRDIDKRKKKHEIPSEIRKDLIDRLINNGVCICGQDIKPGTSGHKKILQWRDKVTDVVVEDSMLNLWRYLSTVKSHYTDMAGTTQSLLQRYAVKKNDLQVAYRKLEDLQGKIGDSARRDAEKLETTRQGIDKRVGHLENEQTNIKSELSVLKELREQLLLERKELEKEEGIRDDLVKRSKLAEDTTNALEAIFEEFTGETRDRIGMDATKYFSELLDDEGRQTLKKIGVDSDYSIQVYDRWDKPFLANISAGQRQVMSIAFISALAKAASGKEIFEMPLFMDTPFGRLSRNHRLKLIERVPEWCTQWILLATDSEFGQYESGILKGTGQWGEFYLLKGSGPGSTKIEKLETSQATALLREEAEVL